jgi:hypothetical protein
MKATVEDLGGFYSGHTDSNGLLNFIFLRADRTTSARSCRVFINHGDNEKRNALAHLIEKRIDQKRDLDSAIDGIVIPSKTSEWFDLDCGKWIPDEPPSTSNEIHSILLKLYLEQRRTNDLLVELLNQQRQPHMIRNRSENMKSQQR